VVWGIWHVIDDSLGEFQDNTFTLATIRWRWVAAAAIFYLASLVPMGWFWYRVLASLGQPVGLYAALRAYIIGHLGKYVPGKALVLVLRAGLLQPAGVPTSAAVLSVILETFNMMAVGAALAAGFLSWQLEGQRAMQIFACGAAAAMMLPLLPPVSRPLIRWLIRKKVRDADSRRRVELPFSVVASGWLAIAVGWFLMTASMMATISAVVMDQQPGWSIDLAVRTVSATTLSVVGGFVSMLPGGIGVREWIMDQLLEAPLGKVSAVLTVVFLRVTWLATEIVAAVVLYLIPPSEER
jgi:uncharacterized membrane protein YbhN (UPF0104 family)